jgi:protein O-mannosyl-transferase
LPAAGLGSVFWLTLSWLACLFGMATKEVMVSAPVIVLLYDRTFIAGSFREALRRRWRQHAALAGTWVLLACLVVANGNRGGTAGAGIGVSWWAYALTQFPAILRYLGLALWPSPLVFDYGVQWVRHPWSVLPCAVAVAVLLAGTAWFASRKPADVKPGSEERAGWRRALGFAGVFFFAILAPTSLVPGNRQTMADHRMYLALAPIVVAVVCAIHARFGRRSRIAFLCLALAAGWATARRNEDYQSNFAIWGDTVAKCPDNLFARNNFGVALAEAGNSAGAMGQFRAAIALSPQSVEARTNLGGLLMEAGKADEGIAQFREALKLEPSFFGVHDNLGTALFQTGKLADAADQYEQALRLEPGNAEVHYKLGLVLRALGRPAEAEAQFKEASRLDPR